jgi:hypothetical protein
MTPVYKRLGFCGIGLLLSACAIAQDMNNPYSAYGIGEIDMQRYNMNSGSGYAGIGLKSNYFSPGNNPASAAGLPRSLLIFDAGTTGKIVGYHGDPINSSNSAGKDFTIKHISLSEKITGFWASSVGFRQFSSVNYEFSDWRSIEGSSNKYLAYYTGNGGLNEYFLNNAFNIGKHLSAGITTSFIAGPITQTESFSDASGLYIESTRRDYYGNYRLETGLLYNTDPGKKNVFSAGVTYTPQSRMNFERALTVSDNSTTFIDEDFIKYNGFKLPATYGAGVGFSNSKGNSFALDYSYYNWTALGYKGTKWKLKDAFRIGAGAEFARLPKSNDKSVQPRSFQVGAYYNSSYLELNGQSIDEYAITAGIKRSLKNRLLIGVSLAAGTRGTTKSGLIKENFAQLSVNLSLRDYIYSKVRKFN